MTAIQAAGRLVHVVIDAWRRFRALDGERRRMIVEAAVLLGLIRLGLRTLQLGRLRRVLDAYSTNRAVRSSGSIATVGWAVQAAGRRFPARRTCLPEALAADAMLRRRGYRSEVRLGIRRRDRSEPLDGHAWVECDGGVVVGALDDLADYTHLQRPRARGGGR